MYALLPERFRFSRGIVVFGALLAFIFIMVVRLALMRTGILSTPPEKISKPYILVAGSEKEMEQVEDLLRLKQLEDKIIGRISVNGNGGHFVTKLNEAGEAVQFLNAGEIIFCNNHLSYKEMIEQLQKLKKIKARFFSGHSIISSDDNAEKGQALSYEDEFQLAKSTNRRLKRLIDIIVSIVSLLLIPLHFFFVKKTAHFLKNCLFVLMGNKTWISYVFHSKELPALRQGVLAPNGAPITKQQTLPPENLRQLDYWYAKDYEPLPDISIILKNYRYLGG
jgi:O-antigen biosynthesis protein